MKRKVLKSSLFIFSLVTLTTIGVNATESSTVTSSSSEVKTEFKVDHEDTVTSESTESIQPRTVFTPEDTEENVINSESTEDTVLKSDDNDVDFLYNEGIKKNILSTISNPIDEWKEMERNFLRPSYEQVIRDNIISNDVSYLSWLEDNNFGVPVNLDPNKYELVMESRGVADNKRKFVNTIQKGDFIVVSSVKDPWAPYVGHAAIATTDNWILDMPGKKLGRESNNRQLRKGDWFNDYQKAWSRIYRVKTSKAVRNDIADWADWRYWSSTHGLKKNRHVKYDLTTFLKGSFDSAYCSKLVWQALYYGSGNLPLVNPRPSAFLMAPYFLPGEISTRYNYNMYGPY